MNRIPTWAINLLIIIAGAALCTWLWTIGTPQP